MFKVCEKDSFIKTDVSKGTIDNSVPEDLLCVDMSWLLSCAEIRVKTRPTLVCSIPEAEV